MRLFERLKTHAAEQWADYTQHDFVEQLGKGELPLECFKHYLVQDYLFLIQFARAYALGIYKSPTVADMRHSLEGVKAILDVELELHIEICERWGMQRQDIEQAPEDTPTMAYTRFVLDAGMAGDLLDLQAALAPCIIGYAEIGKRLHTMGCDKPDNPYQRWIQEYASEGYQELAEGFEAWFEGTAANVLTDHRYPRVLSLFEKACRLESDFWQMGLNVLQKPEI
ncbi:thiaminase II [uncultured Roseibium sp.]|uniref:thiaminase II n=1 Tax=uncultured Roseibium sp. TaxID=1936171 RepID=UPI00260DBAF2|nr:thiaminase II [uncultured Roseibium sp.]